MTAFPQTAAFGKKIPFAALQKQGVPRRFGALVKSIVWSYKFAPDAIGLAATKSVAEIEVIDLSVKVAGASLRVRSSVMEMLNLRIPNPCIFRVTDEDGGPIETAIYPKVSGGVLYGDSAVFRYARRNPSMDGRAQWPSGVTTLESLLIHLSAELAGMSVRPGEPLKDFDARHYAVESLRTEEVKSKSEKGKSAEVLSLPGLESVTQGRLDLEDDPPDVGYANAEIKIGGSELLKNLHMVQDRNNLDRSTMDGHAGRVTLPELEVEMETGTGKTFVYTKTIFELNKRYGWSKFIIIVPGVAIREGVKKSIDITAEKFFADYGKTAKTFIYNSSHPQDILDFSTNPDIQIIVMNVQAFNARSADARRIFMALDEFGSRKPIDLISANRPILILDEPQKMEGTATQEMLPEFNSLFFIDEVAKYRVYGNDDVGTAGEYAKVFEEEYAALVRQQEDLFTDEALKAYWRGDFCKDCGRKDFCGDPIL